MEPATPPDGRATPDDIAAAAAALSGAGDASSRQRSSSPWAFTLSSKAVHRVRSGEPSGLSTPVGQRYARFASSGAPQRQAAAKASYESALLTAVRKQIDTFEEKVGIQINKMQQQEHKLREAAFNRLEEKMHTTEGAQPRLDRRVAELTGNFKGLSDEMQSQIRRVDLMDERLWEWRKEIEEDFRAKFNDYEQRLTKVASTTRVMVSSFEETQKKQNLRLQRIELDAGDRLGAHEETRDALLTLHSRLEALEENGALSIDQEAASERASRPQRSETREEVENNSTLLTLFERRMGDMGEKVERVLQDSIDLAQNSKQQEVQLSSLRTLFDAREEQFRKITERVESADVEGRLEQFRRTLDEESRGRVGLLEKLELLGNRIADQELSYEGLMTRHDQLIQSSMRELQTVGLGAPGVADLELSLAAAEGAAAGGVEDYLARLAATEGRLDALDDEVSSVRESAELGARLGALVAQLQEIVPKVIEHEQKVNDVTDICEKLKAEMDNVACGVTKDLEASVASLREDLGGVAEAMRAQAAQTVQTASDLAEQRACIDDVAARIDGAQAGLESQLQAIKTTDVSRPPASNLSDQDLRKELLAEAGEEAKRAGASAAAAIGKLEQDVKAISQSLQDLSQNRGSVSTEDVVLRHELTSSLEKVQGEHKLLADSSKMLSELRAEVGALKCLHEGSENMTRPQVEQLTESFCKTLREDLLRELTATASPPPAEVAALQSRIEALRAEFLRERDAGASDRGGGDRSGGSCAELEKAVLQDEEVEREKQQKILARIDELCGHIAAVDGAVSRVGQNGAQVVPVGDGIPAEFSDHYKVLADRVEEQSRRWEDLHSQFSGKFDQLGAVVQQVEALSRQG